VGAERAETYLRLLAESELRRAVREAHAPDLDASSHYRNPGLSLPVIAASVQQIRWASGILAAAGALDEETATLVAVGLGTALTVRSGVDGARLPSYLSMIHSEAGTPPRSWHTAQPMRVTPLGQIVQVEGDRAPFDMHVMTLVSTPAVTALTVALRMHWPPDGSSADLELSGAGPQHFPYDQLWAFDDRGVRYSLSFAGEGGTVAWHGRIQLSPALPPDVAWLDLIANGAQRLIRLTIGPSGSQVVPARPAGIVSGEPPTVPPGERPLITAAEHVLSRSWNIAQSVADLRLGEIVQVLTDAGVIAAASPTAGHLAALCEQLGLLGHEITTPVAGQLPVPWASVLAQGFDQAARAHLGHGGPDGTDESQEGFAPLAALLPDIEGTRFALAGLSSAAGESYLHVIFTGGTDSPARAGDTGFSWWLKDNAGHWHLGIADDPQWRLPGDPPPSLAGEAIFRLRLTPPLAVMPDTLEVVVTGPSARVRAIVPVRDSRREGTLST
jgi:hypothetical protein